MNLFQLGDFTLNSGHKSSWKIECDSLTDDDWATLAKMISQIVEPFDIVEGIPNGGLKLAVALQSYSTRGAFRHLLVDDVLTTGKSMNQRKMQITKLPNADDDIIGERKVIGVVLFARGECPKWIRPLLQMPKELWPPPPKCDPIKVY